MMRIKILKASSIYPENVYETSALFSMTSATDTSAKSRFNFSLT